MKTRRMSEQKQPKLIMATGVTTTSRRRISPRSLSKCQTERARKAKMISKSLFGMSNKAELKEHVKATGCSESKASSRWEFDFELGKPAKIQKSYKWEALHSSDVPKVYRINHIKRLYSVAQNTSSFEGQLPKLRYYHHIKKVEPQEENNNQIVSVKSQPITASSKKNGSNGQMKITDFLKEKKRLTVTTKKKE